MYSKRALQKKSHIKHFKSRISVLGIIVMLSSILMGVSSLSSAQADTWVCPTGSALSANDPTPAAGVAPLCHALSTPTTTTAYSCPAGFTLNGSGASATCTEVFTTVPNYSCPVSNGEVGSLAPGSLTCTYLGYNQPIAHGTCPNGGTWEGGTQCLNAIVTTTPAVYAQVWNPPVTTTVNHAAVYAWSPAVQVWVNPVTTTVTVPASTSCQYSSFVSKVVCTTTPAHTSTTTTPGYWNTTYPGGYVLVTAGYSTTTTVPGFYSQGPLITPQQTITTYTTTNNATVTYTNSVVPAWSGPSSVTYVCTGSGVLTGSGATGVCTTSANVIVTTSTSYSCPVNYSNGGTYSTAQDCTISATAPSAPDPVNNLKISFNNDSTDPTQLFDPYHVQVSFPTPNSNGFPITSYNVYWDGPFGDDPSLIESFNVTNSNQVVVNGSVTTVNVPVIVRNPPPTTGFDGNSINITPGDYHLFTVTANNAVGSSTTGDVSGYSVPCVSTDAFCDDPVSNAANAQAWIAQNIGPSAFVDTPPPSALRAANSQNKYANSYAIPRSLFSVPSTKNSAKLTAQLPPLASSIYVYLADMYNLQNQLTQGLNRYNLAYATNSLYAWGGHAALAGSLGLLTPIGADNKSRTEGSNNPLIPWSSLQNKYCTGSSLGSTPTAISTCNTTLDQQSIFKFYKDFPTFNSAGTNLNNSLAGKSPAICGNLPVHNDYVTTSIVSSPSVPGHELYSNFSNGCQLPYVDCSGLVDTVLTWTLSDLTYGSTAPFDPSKWDTEDYFSAVANYPSYFSHVSSLASAQPGDLLLWDFGGGDQHMGFLASFVDVQGKQVTGVIFNSSGTNSGINFRTVSKVVSSSGASIAPGFGPLGNPTKIIRVNLP